MKENRKRSPIESPQSLIEKLKSYSKEHLNDDERTVLNTVFGVFNYTIENREKIFKEQPEFLKDISNTVKDVKKPPIMITLPICPTTENITRMIISYKPIICNFKEFQGDEKNSK